MGCHLWNHAQLPVAPIVAVSSIASVKDHDVAGMDGPCGSGGVFDGHDALLDNASGGLTSTGSVCD